MLPKLIITESTAEKILFIGKSVKVLLASQESNLRSTEEIFSAEIVEVIKDAQKFDYLNFQICVEKIRAHIAEKFLKLFTKNAEIKLHLENLKNYYLLGKGEFYQVFIEEGQEMFKNNPDKFSKNDLNYRVFQSTLMRLNWGIDHPIHDNLEFTLKQNGFDYQNFPNLNGLFAHGNMTHSVDTIRFLANSKSESNACLWYTIKQNIQNGFEMSAHFRFRRAISSLSFNSPLPEGFLIPPELKEHRDVFFSSNLLSFVIQNLSEISSWKKKGSTNLRMIQEYLAISVGFLERDITKGSNLQA